MRKRASSLPGGEPGVCQEIARIIVAIARDMARADHEREIRGEKVQSSPCHTFTR